MQIYVVRAANSFVDHDKDKEAIAAFSTPEAAMVFVRESGRVPGNGMIPSQYAITPLFVDAPQ